MPTRDEWVKRHMAAKRRTENRWAWARLNADGLIVASLAIALGFFDFLYPDYTALAEQIGYLPLTYWFWSTMYLAGGVTMLFGFIRESVPIELAGRLLVILGIGVETTRIASAYGWTTPMVWDRYALFLIVGFFFYLRLTALVGRHGVAVIVGNGNGNGNGNGGSS